MPGFKKHIFVCINERTPDDPRGSCSAKDSKKIHEHFSSEVKKRGLKGSVRANKAGCLDHCAYGPSVVVYPEGVWYTVRTLEDVNEIMDRHIEKGEVVQRLLMEDK
ncbi:MAG: (2Fe-2S) ferredoxin domain-containing protein [Nitrospirae bacterium]|nr:(2Fe-2S) ferredoxin domain-containing protein [Nitrospirota bacterium]